MPESEKKEDTMIDYVVGDILATHTEAVVNPVNCVGVMGRGLALQFKCAYPENCQAYAAACQRGEVRIGRMFVFECEPQDTPRYIINFPTKQHWRNQSRLRDVRSGLVALAHEILVRKIRSISIPALGCGLGGLRWDQVYPAIEEELNDLDDCHLVVYRPSVDP